MNTYEFSLNDKVKLHFEKLLESSHYCDEERVVETVEKTLEKLEAKNVESYILPYIRKLSIMLDMLHDKEWNLNSEDREYVLSAMQYFVLDNDVISDDIPVIGLLDDCIVIDIVSDKLKYEMEAYIEFKQAMTVYAKDKSFTVADWKETKRQELFSRMRNRRNKRKPVARTRGTSFSFG